MKRAGKIAASAAALMMMAGSALAADVPQVVTTVPPPPAAPNFDWAGPYFGAQMGIANYTPELEASLLGGYNFTFGRLLVGFEVRGGIFVPGPGPAYVFQTGARAKAGAFLGDRALAYAAIGGHYIGGFGLSATGALGVALAVGRSISVFTEVQTFLPILSPLMRVRGGLVWHPGN